MGNIKRKTIEGWIDKAWNQLQVASEHLKLRRYSEAIEAAQECIELSVKSVLSLLDIKYSPKHGWIHDSKEFAEIARQIQDRQLLDKLAEHNLAYTVRLPRLLFLMNFWAQFYIVAKYGFEIEYLASARDLFGEEEAKLAIEHAKECYYAAWQLRCLNEDKLAALIPTYSS
jgi:HEPN domain-containing protein